MHNTKKQDKHMNLHWLSGKAISSSSTIIASLDQRVNHTRSEQCSTLPRPPVHHVYKCNTSLLKRVFISGKGTSHYATTVALNRSGSGPQPRPCKITPQRYTIYLKSRSNFIVPVAQYSNSIGDSIKVQSAAQIRRKHFAKHNPCTLL